MEATASPGANGVTKKQKHGLACVQCATAKTKCLRLEKSTSCERCHQLRKQCTSQIPTPRKRRSAAPTTTRVAQLEQKLEGLVSLLAPQAVPTALESPDGHKTEASTTEQMQGSLPTPEGSSISRANTHLSHPGVGTTADKDYMSSSTNLPAFTLSDGSTFLKSKGMQMPRPLRRITSAAMYGEEEGEWLLQRFCSEMMPYFPFGVVQAGETASHLQIERPLLWKVIVMIASSHDSRRQEIMGTEIMEEVTSRMLLSTFSSIKGHNEVGGDKNLELLQSLLFFAAWNHWQFALNGQMTNLLYLAKALTANLGLDKAPGSLDRRALFMNGNPLRCGPGVPNFVPRVHTLEEQRALLACYYLVMAKGQMGSSPIDVMPHSSYIEICCQALEQRQDHPSDLLLVAHVRLQHVVEEIRNTFPVDDLEVFRGWKTPVGICVKAFQSKLSELRRSLLSELEENALYNLSHTSAELTLYEVILYDMPSGSSQPSPLRAFSLDKIDILYACLVSLISFFDVYTALPKSHHAAFPFTIHMQSSSALLIGIELCLLQQDGWELGRVRDSFNLIGALDREIECLEEISAEREAKRQTGFMESTRKDIFWMFAQRMRRMRSSYESKLKAESARAADSRETPTTETDPMDALPTTDLFAGLDENFWQTFSTDQWDAMAMETLDMVPRA